MPAGTAPRRTQAARRAATRGALLDAGVAVLVDEGHAAFTTRRVAERAGVSQGSVMHYFPTRSDLVRDVVRHASERLIAEIVAVGERELRHDPVHRFTAMLDELWTVHNGPVWQAVLELWAAGHRDEAVAGAVRGAAHEVTEHAFAAARRFFGDFVDDPAGAQLVDDLLVMARGCAMDTLIADRAEADRRWRGARDGLIARFAARQEEIDADR